MPYKTLDLQKAERYIKFPTLVYIKKLGWIFELHSTQIHKQLNLCICQIDNGNIHQLLIDGIT
jgi:hypothetical protein